MNLPTIVILLMLAAIAVCTVISYRKRIASGCCGSGGDKTARVAGIGNVADYPCHRVVIIDGMHCENCAARVANAFHREPGVMAKVSLSRGRADVYSREPLKDGRIRQIVAMAGYRVTDIREPSSRRR